MSGHVLPLFQTVDLHDILREFLAQSTFQGRVGLESELSGLSAETAANILLDEFGGQRKVERHEYKYTVKNVEQLYTTVDIWNLNSKLGNLLVRVEDNSTSLDILAKADPKFIEIVSEPLNRAQYLEYQKGISLLYKFGAKGTSSEDALAFQVNVSMCPHRENVLARSSAQNFNISTVINILKNYLRTENRIQIERTLCVPQHRLGFLCGHPDGFMARLFAPGYRPSAWQFYVDSMYRAALEHLGDSRAWVYSETEASYALKQIVERKGFECILPVFKWNLVRYSSLMMYLFPNEWLSRYLEATEWFRPLPILEFREPNSDLNIVGNIDWVLGLVAASAEIGEFTPESLAQDIFARKSKVTAVGF